VGSHRRHSDVQTSPGVIVCRVDGPLFYANAAQVKERLTTLTAADPDVRVVVLDLAGSPDLDVETLDMLAELERQLAELRLASPRAPVLRMLGRAGLAGHVAPTLDAAATPPG